MRRRGSERGLKVSEAACRGVRSGHPWIFRDSIRRELEGADPGSAIRVVDPDGKGLAWALLEPEGAIAARVVSLEDTFRWNPEVISERVERALALRRDVLDASTQDARRLVHGEGDGLPGVAVDQLGEYLVAYKYARSTEPWIDSFLDAVHEQAKPKGIYLQDRTRPVQPDESRPAAALVRGKAAPPEITVAEDGLSFLVDASAPVSPGLFLDLREGRRWVETLARDKNALNLFSFTGSLGLRCVRGGAKSVTNVDAAARSHARCRQNLEASGMDPEACRPMAGDVFKHLEKLRRREETYDLVIVDPPPFSRVKDRVFSALKDWEELMAAIVRVTAPGGEVIVISNASKLSEDELMYAVGGGAIRARRQVTLLGECGLPPDFPVPPAFVEGRYLKIKRLRVV
jgi:23S rRNA (cytosine1962-C5)-methyltransferase